MADMPDVKEIRKASPRIVLLPRFLKKPEIKHLLRLAEGKYKKSTVVDNETGDSVYHDHRSGEMMALGRSQDAVVKSIEDRIAILTQTRPEQGEAIQIIKYGKGDQYKPHYDWFDPKVPGAAKALQQGGQRICTAIMCLQQAERGGETEFPKLGIRLLLNPGDLLLFANVEGGMLQDKAMHAGVPVRAGAKIIATRWLRQRHALGTEEAGARLSEIKKQKEKSCAAEIQEVLRKHGCQLYGQPFIEVDKQTGMLRMHASVELEAILDQ